MYTDFTRRMYKPGLVTYRLSSSDQWRFAVREGSRLADFAALGFHGTMRELLEASVVQRILRSAEETNAWLEIDSLGDLLFGPPVPDPDKILCIGLNYREHAREAGLEVPPVPVVFAKFRNSLIGLGVPIEISDDQSAD